MIFVACATILPSNLVIMTLNTSSFGYTRKVARKYRRVILFKRCRIFCIYVNFMASATL